MGSLPQHSLDRPRGARGRARSWSGAREAARRRREARRRRPGCSAARPRIRRTMWRAPRGRSARARRAARRRTGRPLDEIRIRVRRVSFALEGDRCRGPLRCPKSSSDERAARFDAQFRVCRKMHSETAERVVQTGFHRPDRTLDDFRDLRQVQAVQVVQHDHEGERYGAARVQLSAVRPVPWRNRPGRSRNRRS